MTTQARDRFEWGPDGVTYAVVRVSDQLPFGDQTLFVPGDHGMEPEPLHTGCWRGFIATYRIEEGHLVLHEVLTRVCGYRGGEGPPLGRATLTWNKDECATHYIGAGLRLSFTGRIIIARSVVEEPSPRDRAAWRYDEVLELVFDADVLQSHRDLSGDVAKLCGERGLVAALDSLLLSPAELAERLIADREA